MNIEQKRQALGKRIRAVREEQGLSQSQLALMIGSSKSHIWRIETGASVWASMTWAASPTPWARPVRDLLTF